MADLNAIRKRIAENNKKTAILKAELKEAKQEQEEADAKTQSAIDFQNSTDKKAARKKVNKKYNTKRKLAADKTPQELAAKAEYDKEYRVENLDRIKEQKKEYDSKRAEKAAYAKAYQKENQTALKEKRRQYYLDNKEVIKATNLRWVERNPEMVKEIKKKASQRFNERRKAENLKPIKEKFNFIKSFNKKFNDRKE